MSDTETLNRDTLEALFPEPINRRYFLWALGWEEMEEEDGLPLGEQLWFHPGAGIPEDGEIGAGDCEDGSFTTDTAVDRSHSFLQALARTADNAPLLERLSECYVSYRANNEPEFARGREQLARVKAALRDGTLPARVTTTSPRQAVQDAVQLLLLEEPR